MKHSHLVYDAVKRLLDVTAAAVALVALSPVFAAVALLVLREFGRPVLFMQERPGKDGRPFKLHKFRTMSDAPSGLDAVSAVGTDAGRLTALGRRLRASSLDELPELWDVLVGNMSIVGPRPLLTEYLTRYNDEQARRHEVRPGITGWAQVNGRNAPSWPERLEMDVWYVDHRSFRLDARILSMTVRTVFGREGITSPGSETVEPFDPDADKDTNEEDA